MTSVIRVGQSKFVTVQIDEDSLERIMNCIQTLSELDVKAKEEVQEIFLEDGRKAFGRMLGAQEKRAQEKKAVESDKKKIVQVDDLLMFRQFSKKTADDSIDVRGSWVLRHTHSADNFICEQYDEDERRATGAGEAKEDFISNLSRITQLTGEFVFLYVLASTNVSVNKDSPTQFTARRTSRCTVSISCLVGLAVPYTINTDVLSQTFYSSTKRLTHSRTSVWISRLLGI
jgi:hypothetical protein